jgi:hypothetical protein
MPPKVVAPIVVPPWAKPGRIIWVEVRDKLDLEPIEYLSGTLESLDAKGMAKVLYDDAKAGFDPNVRGDRLMERNPEPKILDDLVDIDPLNDAELLLVLKMRYLAE